MIIWQYDVLCCRQQELGLTAQQEGALLETRIFLLGNMGILTAERNRLCQQLAVSFSDHAHAMQPNRSLQGILYLSHGNKHSLLSAQAKCSCTEQTQHHSTDPC